MSSAICLLVYAAVVTWWCPPLLTRLTRGGLSPRLSVTLWLSAIGSALGAWVVVGVGLVRDVVAGRPDTGPVEYCMQMVAALNRFGALGRVTVVAAGALALVASVLVLRRIILVLRRFWRRSREHARDARVLGSVSRHADVVVVTADRPAAYCVAGRPHAIVVTTGALATLDESELAAVLAHEQAHLAGRHLQLMMLLRALAAAMPRLPLFGTAVAAVGRLVEMAADDSAARRYGRQPLLRGLVALAGQSPVADHALGAADTAALARALRLAGPRRPAAVLRQRILLVAMLVALICAPVAVSAVCQS